jgi:hypothetical protein
MVRTPNCGQPRTRERETRARRRNHDEVQSLSAWRARHGNVAVTRLEELSALGQSVWIDFLSRDLIESGGLERAIEEDAVVGVTSNPSIFGKALSQGSAYDAQIEGSVGDLTDVFHALAMRDVAAACDVMRPVWERTGGRDGASHRG